MNILVIDRAPPLNLQQGNALIGRHLFSRLRHHRLTLVCPAPAEQIPEIRAQLTELFDHVHLVPRPRQIGALMGLVEPALARRGIDLGGKVPVAAVREFEQAVAQLVATNRFDVIHARQIPMAAIAGPLSHPGKLLELIDSETLQSVRRVRAGNPRSWLRYASARVMEQAAVRRFPICTTVAAADADVVGQLAPRTRIEVIPNGVDAHFFAPMDLEEDPETLIFTGAMSFPPNVTAVLHFYQNILPLIRQQRPQVRLVVAGRDPAPQIQALAADEGVTVTGMVDDMRPWLARSAIMICPMVSGSGIKNKVLEALAMARPVVSTTLGMEALEVENGRELRVADEPQAFAAAVLELLQSPDARGKLGRAGRELVLRRYTWDACAASYERLYHDLAARAARSAAGTRRSSLLEDGA